MLDHGALPAGVWEEILPFLGLEPDDETRARARAYGAVNAKDAGRTGYDSAAPSEPARRWAVAYAAETYAKLVQLSSSRRGSGRASQRTREEADAKALTAAREAAAAARANLSAGVGRFGHSAGLDGAPALARGCADDGGGGNSIQQLLSGGGAAETRSYVAVAEQGMRRYHAADLLGAEACWVRALLLATAEDEPTQAPPRVTYHLQKPHAVAAHGIAPRHGQLPRSGPSVRTPLSLPGHMPTRTGTYARPLPAMRGATAVRRLRPAHLAAGRRSARTSWSTWRRSRASSRATSPTASTSGRPRCPEPGRRRRRSRRRARATPSSRARRAPG